MSSAQLDQETFAAEQPNQRTISRAVAEFTPGEGRTLDVRIVPYGVPAEVSDGGPKYREMWMRGAFADQVRAADAGRAKNVLVNFRHGQTIGDVIGHGETLLERDDGLYGTFRVLNGPDGDKALELVHAGALSGVSLEAVPKKSMTTKQGVVQRVKAHLVNIALCPRGAFDTAGVLAVREEEFLLDADLLPVEPDAEVVARCRRLGLKLPERFQETPPEDEDEEETPETS